MEIDSQKPPLSLDELANLIAPPTPPEPTSDELFSQALSKYDAITTGNDIIARVSEKKAVLVGWPGYELREQYVKRAAQEIATSTPDRESAIQRRTDELLSAERVIQEATATDRLQTATLYEEALRLAQLRDTGETSLFSDAELLKKLSSEKRDELLSRKKDFAGNALAQVGTAYLKENHYNPAAIPLLLLSGKFEKLTDTVAATLSHLPEHELDPYKQIVGTAIQIQRNGGVIEFPNIRANLAHLIQLSPLGKIEGIMQSDRLSATGITAADFVGSTMSALPPKQ